MKGNKFQFVRFAARIIAGSSGRSVIALIKKDRKRAECQYALIDAIGKAHLGFLI